MKVEDIKKVVVVGAGTMGQQIGLQCAMHAFPVTLFDIKEEQLDRALHEIKGFLQKMVEEGRLSSTDSDACLERITLLSDAVKAGEDADLLIESVPENPALKALVFAQFGALCPPHAVFTTNTSTLLPSMFAAASGRPSQLAALHFHSYVWDSHVVDIMPHAGTSPETMQLLTDFAKGIGQIPIVLAKEISSYVFNSMINAVISTALNLVSEGVTSVEDVDRSWMGIMKLPAGPFAIMDQIGLDVILDVHKSWAGIVRDRQIMTRIEFLEKYVSQGHHGIKAGRGFYCYPDPEYKKTTFLTGEK